MLIFVLVGIAVSTLAILLVAGTVCWLAGRYLSMGQERPAELLGLYRHAIAWLVGYGLSFAALGMAPAEIISPAVQAWFIAVLGGAIAIAVLICLVWETIAVLKRNCSVRIWLGTIFGVVLALGALLILGTVSWASLMVPARAAQSVNPDVFQHILDVHDGVLDGRWGWALVQWCEAYPGGYAGLIVSIALLTCWHTLRWARSGCPLGQDSCRVSTGADCFLAWVDPC